MSFGEGAGEEGLSRMSWRPVRVNVRSRGKRGKLRVYFGFGGGRSRISDFSSSKSSGLEYGGEGGGLLTGAAEGYPSSKPRTRFHFEVESR